MAQASPSHAPRLAAALNPAPPASPPTDMSLQWYPPPQSTTADAATANMQRRSVDMNVSHLSDTSQLNRRSDKPARDSEHHKQLCQSDLQYLHRKLPDLGGRSSDSSVQNLPKNDDYAPPKAMLDEFSPECIAHAYRKEADQLSRVAAILGDHADHLHPASKFLEAPVADVAERHERPAYSCCGVELDDLSELLTHVDTQHPKHDSAHASPVRGPSRAIDIKAPIPVRPAAQPAVVLSDAKMAWQPHAIRSLPPMPEAIPPHHTRTFSWDFLQSTLKGGAWSPGFYYIYRHKSILPAKAYWILESEHEPFLPAAPGQHGAKMTAFFNETGKGMGPAEENYHNTPVFIRKAGECDYQYFGQYSQLRFSDKISYDTWMEHVPKEVRLAVAQELAENARPAWITQALRKAMFPRPDYNGRVPTDSACNTPKTAETASTSISAALERGVRKDLDNYAYQLKEWEKESSRKVTMLTADDMMKALETEDAAAPPGLRLWWEYLQCIGYDPGFYDMLVALSELPRMAKSNRVSTGRPPTPRLFNDYSTELKQGLVSITKKGNVVRNDQNESVKSVATSSTTPAAVISPAPKPNQAPPPPTTPPITIPTPAPEPTTSSKAPATTYTTPSQAPTATYTTPPKAPTTTNTTPLKAPTVTYKPPEPISPKNKSLSTNLSPGIDSDGLKLTEFVQVTWHDRPLAPAPPAPKSKTTAPQAPAQAPKSLVSASTNKTLPPHLRNKRAAAAATPPPDSSPAAAAAAADNSAEAKA